MAERCAVHNLNGPCDEEATGSIVLAYVDHIVPACRRHLKAADAAMSPGIYCLGLDSDSSEERESS